MKASELDKRFDNGEDIHRYLEFSKARRHGQEIKRVNVNLRLDDQIPGQGGTTAGGSRQSIIKVWVDERLRK